MHHLSPLRGTTGQPIRGTRRPRLSWLRALPLLVRHITRTMPWTTLLTGCLAGIAVLAAVAHVADTSHRPFSQAAVRLAFLPAVYPLIAQLTGWCLLAVAAAACVDRSSFADLGGAIAAPVSLTAIALAWYTPAISRILTEPPATAHGMTIAWYAIATAALALTCAATRDHWHRYTRGPHRPPRPTR